MSRRTLWLCLARISFAIGFFWEDLGDWLYERHACRVLGEGEERQQ